MRELPDYSNANILIIGDLMLDRYWHGGTSRISPEAPVPVVHVQQDEVRAGGAANVALNVAALGNVVPQLHIHHIYPKHIHLSDICTLYLYPYLSWLFQIPFPEI